MVIFVIDSHIITYFNRLYVKMDNMAPSPKWNLKILENGNSRFCVVVTLEGCWCCPASNQGRTRGRITTGTSQDPPLELENITGRGPVQSAATTDKRKMSFHPGRYWTEYANRLSSVRWKSLFLQHSDLVVRCDELVLCCPSLQTVYDCFILLSLRNDLKPRWCVNIFL